MQQPAEIAVAEILSPKCAVTKQLLSVHSVVKVSGAPEVQLVEASVEGGHDVYFALDEEPYFIVVHVVAKPSGLVATGTFTAPHVRAHLIIRSDTVNPSQISERLGVTATSSWFKGQARRPRAAPERKHIWDFEPEKAGPGSLDSKVRSLLVHLEPYAESVAKLACSGLANVTLAICHRDCREWLSGFELSPDLVSGITDLGCTVWYDPYISGPEFPE